MIDLTTIMKKSEKKILSIHPYLQSKAFELIKLAYKEGIYILITQGLRTMEEQAEIYAQGRTKPGKIVSHAKPGDSFHNYGCAFDFAVYKDETCRVINWTVDSKWKRVGELGESLGLEWGGRWTKFKDYPHFQVKGLTLADLKAGKRSIVEVVKKEDSKMKVEDVNKIIKFLGVAWELAVDKASKDEFNRLANELRKASGQEVK